MNIIFMTYFSRSNVKQVEQVASTDRPSENDIEEYIKMQLRRNGVSTDLKKIDMGKGSNVYDYVLSDNSLIEARVTEMQLITFGK